MMLYGLSGFCALALEILWFRVVDVGAKGTAFTFGTVLAIYLLGFAGGALAGATWADRLRRPLLVFTSLQAAILVYAGLGAVAIARLPVDAPLYGWFFGYWRAAQGFRLGTDQDLESLAAPLPRLPEPALPGPDRAHGAVVPGPAARGPRRPARRAGARWASSRPPTSPAARRGAFSSASSSWSGSGPRARWACSSRVVSSSWPWAGATTARGPRSSSWAGLLALLLFFLPGQQAFWQRMHGRDGGSALFDEDASSVAGVTPQGGRFWFVFVDGKSHSVLPYGNDAHTLLGAVPAVIHPAPLDAAIVGLGSGNTAWAAGCRPETRRLKVFEIASPQMRLLRELDRREEFPRLRHLLRDPRLDVETADGRHALGFDEARYDLIEADALWPWSAYSGNLYSVEFFELCSRRLKPGGVVCTWAPTPRIAATFARVFPQAVDVGGILVGSRDPLPFDVEAWTARARSPEVTGYLGRHAARGVLQALRGARRITPPPACPSTATSPPATSSPPPDE